MPPTPVARGPIFVVGMSRSGTKLLRELLNRHPGIAIAPHESHFVPQLLDRMCRRYDEVTPAAQQDFVRHIERTAFYRNMYRSGYRIDADTVTQARSWPDAIEALYRGYLGAHDPAVAWGDKSPSYLLQMPRLLRYFPEARFVHIVRDPRDRAVSARQAWNAAPRIACQQWLAGIAAARAFARDSADHYIELRYEDLVTDTQTALQRVCGFLGIRFRTEMCRPGRAVETRGEPGNPTRHEGHIYQGNVGRCLEALSARELRRLEEIVFPLAGELGYESYSPGLSPRALHPAEWLLAAPGHYAGSLGVFVRRWGFRGGLREALRRLSYHRPAGHSPTGKEDQAPR